MQTVGSGPPTVSQQALQQLCESRQPPTAILRVADAALLSTRVLFRAFRERRPVRITVYMDPTFGKPPVVMELPLQCFDLDWRGQPRGLHGPVASVGESDLQEGTELVEAKSETGASISLRFRVVATNPWKGLRAKPIGNGDFVYAEEPAFSPDTALVVADKRVTGGGVWLWDPQSTIQGQTTAFYLTHRLHVLAAKWTGRPVRLSTRPLPIKPHAVLANAAFNVFTPEMKLGVMMGVPPVEEGGAPRLMELAKSRRAVAHELGHGLMVAIQPYLADGSGDFFGEAFADLVDLFDMLDDPELRRQLLEETAGELRQSSSFSRVSSGVKFLNAEKLRRDMFNDLTIDDVDTNDEDKSHEASVVVSGAIFRVLADVYRELHAAGQAPDEALRIAYERIARLLMVATEILPNHFLEPRDIGRALIAAESQLSGEHLLPLQRELIARGLLAEEDLTAPPPSLAAAFAAEIPPGKVTRKQAERFIRRHAKELGVEYPMSFKVDPLLPTMTGGQLIRFQVTEYEGQRKSLLRNHGSLVTNALGGLIAQHRPFSPGVTTLDVNARLAEIRAQSRVYGVTWDEGLKWILAGDKRNGTVGIRIQRD